MLKSNPKRGTSTLEEPGFSAQGGTLHVATDRFTPLERKPRHLSLKPHSNFLTGFMLRSDELSWTEKGDHFTADTPSVQVTVSAHRDLVVELGKL